jgi:transcriptional regulator with XRE-family HTH domain
VTDRHQPRRSDAYDTALGQRVRAARKLNGLSQTQLATALNISFQQVQKYENGSNRISCSTLKLISAALGVAMVDLLGETGGPQTDALRVDPGLLRSARQLEELPAPGRKVIDSLIQLLGQGSRLGEAA